MRNPVSYDLHVNGPCRQRPSACQLEFLSCSRYTTRANEETLGRATKRWTAGASSPARLTVVASVVHPPFPRDPPPVYTSCDNFRIQKELFGGPYGSCKHLRVREGPRKGVYHVALVFFSAGSRMQTSLLVSLSPPEGLAGWSPGKSIFAAFLAATMAPYSTMRTVLDMTRRLACCNSRCYRPYTHYRGSAQRRRPGG